MQMYLIGNDIGIGKEIFSIKLKKNLLPFYQIQKCGIQTYVFLLVDFKLLAKVLNECYARSMSEIRDSEDL